MSNYVPEDLLYVFDAKYTKNEQPLIVLKDGVEIHPDDADTTMHYGDDFESLLTFNLPTKMRRRKQLISFSECEELIEEVDYGVLSFTYDEIPYTVGMNHAYLNGKFYFHSAREGFKLNSTKVPVSYLMVQDLGVVQEKATHNHKSVAVQGTTRIIEDEIEKKEVLKALVAKLTPEFGKEISPQMVKGVNILELEPRYIIGKVHVR